MTPIPNGSTPSAEAQEPLAFGPADALSSEAVTREDAAPTAPVAPSQPQGRNPEQTTGAAVGGVSANIQIDAEARESGSIEGEAAARAVSPAIPDLADYLAAYIIRKGA